MNLNQNEKCLLGFLQKYCDGFGNSDNKLLNLLEKYNINLQPNTTVWTNPVYEIIEAYEKL